MLVRRPRAGTTAGLFIAVCFVALGLVATATVAVAHADPEDDLRAAQQRANRAAAELSASQTASAKADDAVANSEKRVAQAEAKAAAVRDQVRELAIRRYVEGVAPISRILRMADAGQLVPAQQYTHAVAAQQGDALRQYRADREDLGIELRALEQDREEASAAVATMRKRQVEITQELDRLGRVVAAAKAAREAEQRAQAAAAAAAAQAQSQSQTQGASGGAGGGRTVPTVTVPSVVMPATGSADWLCPVQGPHAFSNDYGAARWGGGTHMGNDIMSPRGTPVVASVSGTVTHRWGSVSGNAYYLEGDDGNQYFGAHLDSFGANGQVAAGTVVGYVGNTGDASGGATHLHFEIHPGGRGYVNPYPTLVRYC